MATKRISSRHREQERLIRWAADDFALGHLAAMCGRQDFAGRWFEASRARMAEAVRPPKRQTAGEAANRPKSSGTLDRRTGDA